MFLVLKSTGFVLQVSESLFLNFKLMYFLQRYFLLPNSQMFLNK